MEQIKSLNLPNSKIIEIEMVKRNADEDNNIQALPKICRVVIESSFSEESFIISELWMPDNWNGVFVGLGNGGPAGNINADFMKYAQDGYAVAQTDMGTSLVVNKKKLIGTPDLWKDYGWRSTHIMTVVSKMIIEAYYGRKAEYSYFFGESAGGLQAFSEAQRFPDDYNGILAGVPSNNALYFMVYFLWLYNHMRTPEGTGVITRALSNKIGDCAAAFFQARGDGEAGDNFVTYPYAGPETVKEFISFLREKIPELTEQQLFALEAAYNGPVNPKTNEQIFCGLPIGSEPNSGLLGEPDSIATELGYPWFRLFFGQDFKGRTFDFADHVDIMKESIGDDFTANNPDLTPFKSRGGKFLVYSGSADPAGPWPDALKYYNRVCAKMGGYEKVSDFFKYFILPGKGHGGDGRGVNVWWGDMEEQALLDTLRNWCEKNEEPEYIVGARRIKSGEDAGKIAWKRKIDPYKADKEEGKDFPRSCDSRYLK